MKSTPKNAYCRTGISAEEVCGRCARDGKGVEEMMLGLLERAGGYAESPISGFKVGAVVRGLSGSLYLGANFEFLGEVLTFDIHAEQAAAVNAWLEGEEGLTALAVSSPPCGYCRQFLNELAGAEGLRIIVPGRPTRTLCDLLPDAFGPRDLGVEGALMLPMNHPLELETPTDDPAVRAALEAASMSYAPYTRAYAGVSLLTEDQQLYRGPYAENAAFNPSLAPLATALARMRLCGGKYRGIRRAVLVEQKSASTSQADATRIVLEAVAPRAAFEVAYARPSSPPL